VALLGTFAPSPGYQTLVGVLAPVLSRSACSRRPGPCRDRCDDRKGRGVPPGVHEPSSGRSGCVVGGDTAGIVVLRVAASGALGARVDEYCCSRCAMSSSVDSVSPRRDFFMNNAYGGRRWRPEWTRWQPLPSVQSASCRAGAHACLPCGRLQAVHISLLTHLRGATTGITPVFCAAIDVWRVLDALEGFRWTVEADRPEHNTRERSAASVVNCARFVAERV